MESNKQKVHSSGRSGVGTGTTSLLMIFTVLCFATLAMLSLSTAASQQRIQQRGATGTVNTAAAKGEAAVAVAGLDAALLEGAGQSHANDAAYYTAMEALAESHGFAVDAESHTLTLVVAVDGTTELVTDLQLLPPGGAYRYKVAGQVTRLTEGWTPGGGAGVWQG